MKELQKKKDITEKPGSDIERALQKSNKALEIMENILNQLDSMIYVSDPRTDEVLFLNDRIRQHFGFEGGLGETCYKLFQDGLKERCEFCPCRQLDEDPDAVVIWEEHNTLTNRVYRNTDRYIDWVDGRKVHIQNSFDITDLSRTQLELEHQEKLTEALNKTAMTMLSQGDKEFEDVLDIGLFPIADTVGLSQIVVFYFTGAQGEALEQLYRWDLAEGGLVDTTENVKFMLNQPPFSDWMKIWADGRYINNTVSGFDKPSADFLHRFGIKSIYMVPITVQRELWGVVSFWDHINERVFNEVEAELLNSAAHLFANAIMQNRMERDLAIERELYDKQIHDALEQAKNASKAKGDFLSNMSHEMRTPLNAIIGMTAIGKKAGDLENKNHALNKIGDASTHLLAVINDVLDMAKIEANKLEFNSIEYNFVQMLEKVLTITRFRADEKNLNLTVEIDENIPRFMIGDDQRLSQVIMNLISNSVKFTPEKGEVHVEAVLEEEVDSVCTLRISVSDSGIGISPEKHEKLFQAFEQAESGTSREYGGTGLGLVISKQIIEYMEGRIWIESELGKGATFIFTVKMKRGERNDDIVDEDVEAGVEDGDLRENEFRGKKLLLAEDIEINREILMSLLEGSGLEIDCAENGKEAFDMIEAEPDKYDAVFMDIQMPKMNGFEATRNIRSLPGHDREKLPIIAMTANVFKSDIDECLAAGMDSHVGKPLDIDRVLESLRKYLLKRK